MGTAARGDADSCPGGVPDVALGDTVSGRGADELMIGLGDL